MDSNQIKYFLTRANLAGYGNEKAEIIDEPNRSHTIKYAEKDWTFHDNYFGGEPYGGREVIFYQERPVWIMVYYGAILDKNLNSSEIYSFLRKALMAFPKDMPMRGPEKLLGRDWSYKNEVKGDFESFSGEEIICFKDEIVYSAKYQGGLVDCV